MDLAPVRGPSVAEVSSVSAECGWPEHVLNRVKAEYDAYMTAQNTDCIMLYEGGSGHYWEGEQMATNDAQHASTLAAISQGRLTVGLRFDPPHGVVEIESTWCEFKPEDDDRKLEWHGRVYLSSLQMDGIVRTWLRLRGGSIPNEETS
jgi:hypothetical protein